VDCTLKGYNSTVLAYGQTGLGKTHTMGSGDGEAYARDNSKLGIIPRTVRELFARVGVVGTDLEGSTLTAKVSFVEVYKEDIHDLLQRPAETSSEDNAGATVKLATLDIRETKEGGISLPGMHVRSVGCPDEALAALAEGSRNRATGSTQMNATSSRSHAIFSVSLELTLKGGKILTPRFNFVDLAGSERASKTGASGERFVESVQINTSLLALGKVISALCEKQSHVPYRDSKLTRLLQDALGGNAHTLMIACVSPSDADKEESLSTLKYANRMRQIQNKPRIASDPVQAQIAKLTEQVAMRDARLQHYEAGEGPLNPPPGAAPAGLEAATASAAPEYGAPLREAFVEGTKGLTRTQELLEAKDDGMAAEVGEMRRALLKLEASVRVLLRGVEEIKAKVCADTMEAGAERACAHAREKRDAEELAVLQAENAALRFEAAAARAPPPLLGDGGAGCVGTPESPQAGARSDSDSVGSGNAGASVAAALDAAPHTAAHPAAFSALSAAAPSAASHAAAQEPRVNPPKCTARKPKPAAALVDWTGRELRSRPRQEKERPVATRVAAEGNKSIVNLTVESEDEMTESEVGMKGSSAEQETSDVDWVDTDEAKKMAPVKSRSSHTATARTTRAPPSSKSNSVVKMKIMTVNQNAAMVKRKAGRPFGSGIPKETAALRKADYRKRKWENGGKSLGRIRSTPQKIATAINKAASRLQREATRAHESSQKGKIEGR